jgi:hypothetical protein
VKRNLDDSSGSVLPSESRGEKSKLAVVDPPTDSEFSEDEFDRMSQVQLVSFQMEFQLVVILPSSSVNNCISFLTKKILPYVVLVR